MTHQEYADSRKLYAIHFPDGSSEIVMKVTTDRKGFKGVCYLSPPDHGHMINGIVETQTENGFIFLAERGEQSERWEFTEMTYDIFKDGFFEQVYGGEQLLEKVHNTEELVDYYYSNFPDYT